MKNYSIVLFFFAVTQCSLLSQSVIENKLGRDTIRCYAQCEVSNDTSNWIQDFPIYKGKNYKHLVYVKQMKVRFITTMKWERVKNDRNCLSVDPEDCMVWHLNEITPWEMDMIVVTDTSLTKNYKWKSINFEHDKVLDQIFERREVVCPENLTAEFLNKILFELDDSGYYVNQSDTLDINEIRSALIEYQKDKNLPVGNFNIQSLKALGVIN